MAAAVRPVAGGRPGTEVVPTGWEAAHAAPAAGTMTATVEIRQPGGTQEWDDASESTVTVPFAPYATVAARVQALTNDAQVVDAAEQSVTVSGYLVTVPADTSPARGHLVTVTATNDPLLEGRELRVTDVVLGSLRFERDLFCDLT